MEFRAFLTPQSKHFSSKENSLASSNYGVVGTPYRILPSKLSVDQFKKPFGDLKNTPLKTDGFFVGKRDMTVQRATPTARPIPLKANNDDAPKATPESTGADAEFEAIDEIDFRNENIFSMLDEIQFNRIFMDGPNSVPPSPMTPPLSPASPSSPWLPPPDIFEMECYDVSIDMPSLDSEVGELDDIPPINLSLIEFE